MEFADLLPEGEENDALAELKKRRMLKEARRRQRAHRLNDRSTETYVPRLVPFRNKKIVIVQISCGGDMIGAHTLALTKYSYLSRRVGVGGPQHHTDSSPTHRNT